MHAWPTSIHPTPTPRQLEIARVIRDGLRDDNRPRRAWLRLRVR